MTPPNAGKGRPKGVPNKNTAILRDAIIKAAEAAGGGGDEGLVTYLTEQATASPAAFLSLLGKVLPLQVTGEDGAAIKTDNTLRLVFMKPGERSAEDDHGA